MSETRLTPSDYPISVRRPELLRTPTGATMDDLTMDKVMSGEIVAEDFRITPDTLRMQGEIAEATGRTQLADNFRRAAEMTAIPDETVLAMYNALRPNASSKDELIALADRLETEFSAPHCGGLVREAADVYERREILADPEQ